MNTNRTNASDLIAPPTTSLEAVARSIPTIGIDFGYCAVSLETHRTLTLQNLTPRSVQGSSIQFSITASGDNYFTLSHSNGIIQAHKKQDIVLTFRTDEAKVLVSLFVIKLHDISTGQELSRTLKVSAIGKYPFITINQEIVDFQSLLIGKTLTKEITINNSSPVPTSFTIERVHDDGKDKSLQLSHNHADLSPGGSSTVTITYTPLIQDIVTCSYFKVIAAGGNELSFTCSGTATGYDVELSAKSLHFGEVQIETETNRILNVINNSDLPTQFQLSTDPSNTFNFSQNVGTVKPHSSTRIVVNFCPKKTGNFYERVFCVVRNHKVLYIDMIGTCFDILTKPIPLLQRHIDVYRHKVTMGAHNKVVSSKNKTITDTAYISQSSLDGLDYQYEIPIDDPSQVALHKEMLLPFTSEKRDVQLSSDSIDFSFTDSGRLSEPKAITLQNKFSFPVRVDWTLLQVLNKTTNKFVKNPFIVSPSQQEIPPRSSFTFNVEFAPFEPDSYFFQIAQCFVHLLNGNQFKNKVLAASVTSDNGKSSKSMNKTKTLLGATKQSKYADYNNEEIDPPLCINLPLSGHSFAPGSQPFIPMVKISAHKVDFKPCGPFESVYQTIILSNTSDTPVLFKILQDSTGTFQAYPQLGIVPGKSFALITYEFSPKSARFFNFASQLIFNNSSANLQSVQLQGCCYAPQITFPQDKLFFPPIFTGVSQRQKFAIKNNSRIPLEYDWKVPEKYTNEVTLQPVKAVLLPNQEQVIVATFTALKKKNYEITIPMHIKNLYDHAKHAVGFFNPGSGLNLTGKATEEGIIQIKKSIQIIGAGNDGNIEISPQLLDFGTITVGFGKTLSIVITNKSNCNLYIELMMQANNEAEGQEKAQEIQKILNECFKFDNKKGIVNAKSKMKVNITFKPSCRFQFETKLICVAREKMSKELQQTLVLQKTRAGEKVQPKIIEKASISIKCNGDYPLLRFTDIRNDQVSIANLWERFQMTFMNKELLQPLSTAEFFFNNSDKSNATNEELMEGLNKFAWDFGKVPIRNGSKPRKITLTLKNIGGVPADFRFKMPNDSEIEMESWADPGEPTSEQAFEKHILAKKIFVIEPKTGSLLPGEQMDFSVFYFPKEVMKHHLNIFFQISNGKPLLLEFQGETLHRRAQLQMLKHTYQLPPVPIGLEWAITYPIEIKNLGITKLKYQIDTQRLEELNKSNYDFRIFEIQNPEGTLKTNETSHIYTLFRPLEAKSYSLDLPIKVSDIEGPSAESYMLRLRGQGYLTEETRPNVEQFYEDLPNCRAHLTENGSMAAFSTESIDFGELQANELSKRFVILYNLHSTQKMKFDFQKSGLMCGDNLKLEPMSGELKPNTHLNIKMTLTPSKYPTYFEGEIQCSIDWENNAADHKEETKSVHTNTNVPECSEYLFLRLRKRTKITKILLGADARRGESLIENVVNEAMHDILESAEFDKLLDDCTSSRAGLYLHAINNEGEPEVEDAQVIEVSDSEEDTARAVYEKHLREVTGVEEDELFRKRMFMQEPFVELMEFMLEDTMFNLMEEATYEEFDLTQPPKIYIRKDQ